VNCPAWAREPKKARYLEFEEDTELEFEFLLTLKLGHGSVVAMRKALSNKEYLQWRMYYQREAQRRELEQMKAGV
jgi:hypothetical protein